MIRRNNTLFKAIVSFQMRSMENTIQPSGKILFVDQIHFYTNTVNRDKPDYICNINLCGVRTLVIVCLFFFCFYSFYSYSAMAEG